MDSRRGHQTTYVTRYSIYTSLRLQPYRLYSCCVAAVNEAGTGNSSCQVIFTHEAGELHVYAHNFMYNVLIKQLSLL